MDNKKLYEKNMSHWRRIYNGFLGFGAAIVVVVVAVIAIIVMIFITNGESAQRYCFTSDPELLGSLTVNNNARSISWDLQYTGDPTYWLRIMGPIPAGGITGPLHVALCGIPSTLTCDTSVVGVLKDTITSTYTGGSLTTTINDIRKEPWRYYLHFESISNTTTRVPLGQICGTANS